MHCLMSTTLELRRINTDYYSDLFQSMVDIHTSTALNDPPSKDGASMPIPNLRESFGDFT